MRFFAYLVFYSSIFVIYHLSKHRFVTHFCAILASFSTIFVLFSDIFSFILGSAIRREKCDSFHFRYFSPIKKSPALCRTSIFDRTATSHFFQRIPALFVFMSLYVRCVHGMEVFIQYSRRNFLCYTFYSLPLLLPRFTRCRHDAVFFSPLLRQKKANCAFFYLRRPFKNKK